MRRAALALGVALLAALPSTAFASSYSDAIATTPGLAGYWRLGEAASSSALPAAGTVIGSWVGSVTLGAPGAPSVRPPPVLHVPTTAPAAGRALAPLASPRRQ